MIFKFEDIFSLLMSKYLPMVLSDANNPNTQNSTTNRIKIGYFFGFYV